MRKIIALFLVLIGMSCENEKKLEVDTSEIKVVFKIERFDKDFYKSNKSLTELKTSYPFLFPESIEDSVWVNKRKNTDELELFDEVQNVYEDIGEVHKKIKKLFKHVKYYNRRFNVPRVISILSNIDYQSRVVYRDNLLLISLDVYLGSQHKFYSDYPSYIKQNNTNEYMIVDIASKIIDQQLVLKRNRAFVHKMIYQGKKMYLKDVYLTMIPSYLKIGYTEEKFEWALENEEQIWQYFIEKDLLFSTDKNLDRRFLDIAPFSKFYMEHDNLSPGRIGEFIGWQIVRSFMRNNDVSLQELIRMKEEEIFEKSKYKPRRQ